ncbi:MAG: DUF4974 domain-containing protein [Cyclobacteriaceae bacterium]|nr:DUF4974 domain-containing protein [Cyclobacteriaceae bacterium]
MNNTHFIELVGKKLSNSISEDEEVQLDCFLMDEDNLNIYNKYKNIWIGSKEEATALNTNAVYNKIQSRLQKNSIPHHAIGSAVGKPIKWIRIFSYAAVFIVLLVAGFSLPNFFERSQKDTVVVAKMIHKANPIGQKSTVFLPDGSKVVLNSNSTLSYQENFTNGVREVTLEGEAFFEIEKDPDKPFSVLTKQMKVQVLGTSFNLRAFQEQDVQIALLSGKVEVVEEGNYYNDTISLEPGEAIAYDIQKKKFRAKTQFDPEEVVCWKDGILYFDTASINEVIDELSDWYGVSFTIRGTPHKTWSYSGKFDNYTLQNVLIAMSFTEKFEYKIEGKDVLLKF